MASRFTYSKTIHNNYLNVSKEIKGYTSHEVNIKVQEQLRKWDELEKKKRERERLDDLKSQADYDTSKVLEEIEQYKNILKSYISMEDKFQWVSLKDKSEYSPFLYKENPPDLNNIKKQVRVPNEKKFLEMLFKSIKQKRLDKEVQAKEIFDEKMNDYNKKFDKSKEDYELEKRKFIEKQQEFNKSIDQFQLDFEEGHSDSIERYVRIILERAKYPEGFESQYEMQYDLFSNTIIVAFELPGKENIPDIIQYKYVNTRKEIDIIKMKQKDFNLYYEDILYQICLKTIHELFKEVYIKEVKSVVFNGWISGIDPKDGNDFRSCIMSCHVNRDEFEKINLQRVDVKECFKSLKGLTAGPLSQYAPVQPIMNINKQDSRFVESREVLANINSTTNLAEMDWNDFEQLVRQLFTKIFSKDGCEVHVTQASRDGGVDAIAFDEDPIRGGKFVIQAKRYNNVVPVSAVRDLYGTMISEGATKGILVTTSYYGNDSRTFAKDKPITLIDGPNLVYMFQEYGHDVTIKLKNK